MRNSSRKPHENHYVAAFQTFRKKPARLASGFAGRHPAGLARRFAQPEDRVFPGRTDQGGGPGLELVHATLREVSRVLVPEGRVVISGFNPTSLWGLRQRRGHLYQRWGYDSFFLPKTGEFIGYWRLRDWLRLLDFEVESGRFGCYRPALASQAWLDRFEWMDAAGERWWSIFGAVYFLAAVKRVRGVRLLEPAWKTRKAPAAAPAAVANKEPAVRLRPPG